MENTLQASIPPVIEKPKIRVIKKVIKKRPPANSNSNNNNKSDDINKLNNKISNLNIKDSSNNSDSDRIEIKKDEYGNSVIKNKPQVFSKSEILKKTITEKVHFDKLTFDAQLFLIENETTEDKLKNHYYNLLQDSHYRDIVVERSASLKCGYPCCSKSIEGKKKLNQKYQISIKEQKVYNVEELSMFCSSDCLIKSKLFESTLDPTAVYLRKINGISKTPNSNSTNTTNNSDNNDNTTPDDTVFNSFEKSLKITENENASLQPPSTVFGNNGDTSTFGNKSLEKRQQQQNNNKETTLTTKTAATETTTKEVSNKKNNNSKITEKKKIKIIETDNIPIVNNSNKIKDSDDEDSDQDNFEDYENDSSEEFEDENQPMMVNESDDDDEEEDSDELDQESIKNEDTTPAESSEDEFSLFRPSTLGAKRYKDLYKPSNYHIIYSALSQFITKHTINFIKSNEVNYEYILEQNIEIKSSLHTQLNLIYPSLLEQLKFRLTTGKDKVIMLIDTFKFDKPIPSLKRNHWRIIILVFFKALSLNDKDLETDIKNNFDDFKNIVKECEFDLETLKVFEDLLIYGYE